MSRRHRIFTFTASARDMELNFLQFLSPQRKTALHSHVGREVVRRFAEYIYNASRTRHRTARRLGATPTGVLEFSRSCPAYTKRGGKIWYKVAGGVANIIIQGVAGLARAFGALDIYPRKAKALTIPIAKEAYAQTAGEMESKGWHLFIPRRNRERQANVIGCLWGRKGAMSKPLFALRRHVHIRHDRKLLPSEEMVGMWTLDAASEYLEEAGL